MSKLTHRCICLTCGLSRDYQGKYYRPMLQCAACGRRRLHSIVGEPTPRDQEESYHPAQARLIAEILRLEDLVGRLCDVTECEMNDDYTYQLVEPFAGEPWRLWINARCSLQGRARALEQALKRIAEGPGITEDERRRGVVWTLSTKPGDVVGEQTAWVPKRV